MLCPRCGNRTNQPVCPLCGTATSPEVSRSFQQFHNPSGKRDPDQHNIHLIMVVGCAIFGGIFAMIYAFAFLIGILSALAQ